MVDSDWSEHAIYTKMYLIYYSLSWLKYISIRVKLAVKMFVTHPIPVELNPVLNALNLIRWHLSFWWLILISNLNIRLIQQSHESIPESGTLTFLSQNCLLSDEAESSAKNLLATIFSLMWVKEYNLVDYNLLNELERKKNRLTSKADLDWTPNVLNYRLAERFINESNQIKRAMSTYQKQWDIQDLLDLIGIDTEFMKDIYNGNNFLLSKISAHFSSWLKIRDNIRNHPNFLSKL